MNYAKRLLQILICGLLSIPVATFVVTSEISAQSKTTTKNRRSKKKTQASQNISSVNKNNKKVETADDIKKRQQEAEAEIKQTKTRLEENEKSVRAGLKELGKIEDDIIVSEKKMAEISNQINILNSKISALESHITSDEAELQKLRDEYLKAVKKMRLARKGNSELAFIFSSDNFNQALRRMRYLKEFSEWKDKQSNAIDNKLSSLKIQRENLAKTVEQQKGVLKNQENEKTKLQKQYSRQNVLVADLKKNGEALQSHLSKKQTEANQLKNRISELIAEEQRKAAEEKARKEAEERARLEAEEKARKDAAEKERLLAEAKAEAEKKEQQAPVASSETKQSSKKDSKVKKEDIKTVEKKQEKEERPLNYADARKRQPRSGESSSVSTSANTSGKSSQIASDFAEMKGNLPRPVSGTFKVTSRFGRQSLPDLPDVEFDNPGIDAEVAAGASAIAVFPGKVSGVYMLPGYNTVVIVNHGNYYTVYGNINSPTVKVGDNIKTGQGLGVLTVDDDDSSHGSIHFEVWKNREKLNPLEWIRN